MKMGQRVLCSTFIGLALSQVAWLVSAAAMAPLVFVRSDTPEHSVCMGRCAEHQTHVILSAGPGGGRSARTTEPSTRRTAPDQSRDIEADRDIDVDVDVDIDDDERDYLIEDDTARGFVAGVAVGAAAASNTGSSETNSTCPDENGDGVCDEAQDE